MAVSPLLSRPSVQLGLGGDGEGLTGLGEGAIGGGGGGVLAAQMPFWQSLLLQSHTPLRRQTHAVSEPHPSRVSISHSSIQGAAHVRG